MTYPKKGGNDDDRNGKDEYEINEIPIDKVKYEKTEGSGRQNPQNTESGFSFITEDCHFIEWMYRDKKITGTNRNRE